MVSITIAMITDLNTSNVINKLFFLFQLFLYLLHLNTSNVINKQLYKALKGEI